MSVVFRPGQLLRTHYPATLYAKGSESSGVAVENDVFCLVLEQQLCVQTQLEHTGRFRSARDLRFKTVEVEKARVVLSDGRCGWIRCDYLKPVDEDI